MKLPHCLNMSKLFYLKHTFMNLYFYIKLTFCALSLFNSTSKCLSHSQVLHKFKLIFLSLYKFQACTFNFLSSQCSRNVFAWLLCEPEPTLCSCSELDGLHAHLDELCIYKHTHSFYIIKEWTHRHTETNIQQRGMKRIKKI